eukprot:COSAG04_NODE_7934_length_1043_cov_454.538624_1_plen_172_part_10
MAESSEEVQRKRLSLQETMHSTAVEFARLISSEITNSLIVAVLLQEPAPEEGEPPEESPKKKKKKKNKKKQRDDAHAEFGMAFDSDEEEDSISGLPAADKKGKKEKKKKVKKVGKQKMMHCSNVYGSSELCTATRSESNTVQLSVAYTERSVALVRRGRCWRLATIQWRNRQ